MVFLNIIAGGICAALSVYSGFEGEVLFSAINAGICIMNIGLVIINRD